MSFQAIDTSSIYPQVSSTERGHRIAHNLTTAESSQYVIAGYPDDEGVSLNGGRIGAAEGPDAIRKQLYKMTLHPQLKTPPRLHDCGNLSDKLALAERHEFSAKTSLESLAEGKTWIGLGGGHDYGYPDGKAFLQHNKNSKRKPLVINFDAHLDVRPDDKNLNSGTPFFRLNKFAKENSIDFDFVQIGIQPQCNSKEHFEWCLERGVRILSWDEIAHSPLSLSELLNQRWPDLFETPKPTFLSVDIDAFSSSHAMGCSQAWPIGLTPEDFFPCFKILCERLDVQSLGIYEVAPNLDLDNRTSKLAALIVYNFLFKDL